MFFAPHPDVPVFPLQKTRYNKIQKNFKKFTQTCQPAMPKRSQCAARGSAGQTEGAHPLTIYTVGLGRV